MYSLQVASLLLLVGVEYASAQISQWGQCGGQGWTGLSTCTVGFACVEQNPYYSQCIPGTASSSIASSATSTHTTLATSTSSVKASSTSSSVVATGTAAAACSGTFTPISASAAFAALNPGWNLGNTLEAIPTEGSWNNAPVVASTFSDIKAAGFKSIRLPVTWYTHLTTASPTWLIDPTWMARVTTVVDEVIALGLPVIINMHGDASQWANLESTSDYTALEEQWTAMWTQVATNFACHSSLLMFEPLNEPAGTTEAQADEMNRLNELFLTTINNVGGFNPQRVVALSGLGMDSIMTSQWFVRPTVFPDQPWGIEFHYYSPYQFIFSAWGATIWGSSADQASLASDFQNFAGNFTGIPAFVGEWDASPANTETAARWKYWDFLIRTANSHGYSTMIWDNGGDVFDRLTNKFYDPTAVSILFNAAKGVINSLADSTTDALAAVQSTSAFLFQKVGTAVVSQSIPYLLNGNKLVSIKNSAGTMLTSSQYSMASNGSLTLTSSYLSTLLTTTSTPGSKENLTLTFSAGSPLVLQIVVYSTPTVATTTFAADPSKSLSIPITYEGLPYPATIKAIYTDGTYVDSSWTEFLGPLQQARWTYNNYYNWDSGDIVIEAGGSAEIVAGGMDAVLMIEFYPRDGTGVGSNTVNVTITV